MKQITTVLGGAAVLFAGLVTVHAAPPALREYAFNFDGSVTDTFNPPGGLTPVAGVNYGTFDPDDGLGSFTIGILGAGSHDIRVFFDHDAGPVIGDETGSTGGSVIAGQSWEIDEPGYGNNVYVGDIWSNFSSGTLDNSIFAGPDDMAMAMGWTFDGPATIAVTLSENPPASGFYLKQYDGENAVYLSGILRTEDDSGGNLPDGGATLPALVGAVLGLGALARRVRR
jgi:hypothetical protein